MKYYRKHFKNKIVLCNCDDPFESNFFKYFVLNFNRLGLKKLIATSYAESSIMGTQLDFNVEENGQMSFYYDEEINENNHLKQPYKAIVNTVHDMTGDGGIHMLDIAELFKSGENELTVLDGNRDFRSPECLALLDEADIVVTNPPFSLFREYVTTLIEHDKKFIIIGNINAITYKEFFPLLQNNQVWIGASIHSGDRKFNVPDDYPMNAASCGVDENGQRFIRVKGVRWYTNLDLKQRHEELILVKKYTPGKYVKYDNYDAINVDRTADIPYNYDGPMGVPITFMDKYNPNQFKILGLLQSSDEKQAGIPILRTYNDFKEMRQDMTYTGSSGTKANGNPVLPGKSKKGNFLYNPKTNEYVHSAYARIVIEIKEAK